MEDLSRVEQSFTEAIKNRDFYVWYQPQIDMRTGSSRGGEALVRWQRKDGALIPPDRFVSELEQAGLMPALDEEVVKIVCKDACEAKQRGCLFGPVSVNLSRLHAGREGGPDWIRKVTAHYGIQPGEIFFEITETAAEGEDGAELMRFAHQLQKEGYRIAMDDYGTGNSTLKLLQEIRFDILKLDRHFVSRIGDPRADVILASTIDMAGRLGMEVVAEGVETEEQIRFLMENQCYLGHGYYYSRPLTKEQYIRWRSRYEETV